MTPEPWLRGPIEGVDARVAPLLYAFRQVKEDLERHTAGLGDEQVWARPHGLTPLGFQLRHMAGSVERLVTYLEGRALSERQLAALKAEEEPVGSLRELLRDVERSFQEAEAVVRRIDPGSLSEPRYIGRKRLPTTVIGLLTHIAEHTQRHLGEAISAAKLARAAGIER